MTTYDGRIRDGQTESLEEFLSRHDAQLIEKRYCWEVNFIPKGHVRSGGLRIKVSKETLEVVEITHLQ
jgi:hypothetical protein